MRKILLAIVAIFVLGAFSASAQKMGHFDYMAVMDSLTTYKTAQKKAEEVASEFEETYKAVEAEFEKRYNAYIAGADTMNQYLAAMEEQSLQQMQASLQGLQQQYQQSLQTIQERYYVPIEKWLKEAVGIVGKRKGLDYVLYHDEQNSIFWVNPDKGIDITNEVLTEMLRIEKENPIRTPGE